LESDRRGATAGLFVFESGNDGKTYVLPAMLGRDTYEVAHDSGEFPVTVRAPTARGLEFLTKARHSKLELYSASTKGKLAALTEALAQMKTDLEGKRKGLPGIPAAAVSTYVDMANLGTRGGGQGSDAIAFDADQLLGNKDWTQADARKLEIPLDLSASHK